MKKINDGNNIHGGPNSFSIYGLPSPKNRVKVIEEVAKEFESFFIREFLNNSFQMSGELSEKYGYFYKEIIIDTLSRTSSFGLKDFLRKAIENQLEAVQRGYIKGKNKVGKF